MAKSISLFNWIKVIGLLSLVSLSLNAQTGSFEPYSGQAGKDVVWVPTSQALVNKMLDMAQVKPDDYLMDLGSGDGRLVITAAKRGATAVGIEYNPEMVKYAKGKAAEVGLANKANFIEADLFKTDLSKATVVTLFLLRTINLELRPKLLKLNPGTRIVSNTFDMGEWEPDEQANVTDGCESGFCEALLWIVPADVKGTWKVGQDKLTLDQEFQKVSGTLNSEKIKDGRLKGTEISFKVNKDTYIGTVAGNKMEGTVTTAKGTEKWTAVLQN